MTPPQDSAPKKKRNDPTADWVEKPRCKICTHRRIFHFRGIAGNSGKGVTREIPVRCSMPGCGCPIYHPVDEERVDAMVVGAETASRETPPYGDTHETDTEGA